MARRSIQNPHFSLLCRWKTRIAFNLLCRWKRLRIDIIGLIADTCVEATVRYAVELGYEVTMVRDATADYSDREMHAAPDVNIPSYASAIVTTNEVVDAIASL